MRFAVSNGQRIESQPGLAGQCPVCEMSVIAKCGEVKVWHWAHRGRRTCDPWWENETKWHRQWKNRFPQAWQEIVQLDESGEKHIADVKTERGCVLEFQHSYLNPEERRSREKFYKQLIWVVDGTRRVRDHVQFREVLSEGRVVERRAGIVRVFPDDCRLLTEWGDSVFPVLFDFSGETGSPDSVLWLLLPKVVGGAAYVLPISASEFVARHRESIQSNEEFGQIVQDLSSRISLHVRNQARTQVHSVPRRTVSRVRRTPRF